MLCRAVFRPNHRSKFEPVAAAAASWFAHARSSSSLRFAAEPRNARTRTHTRDAQIWISQTAPTHQRKPHRFFGARNQKQQASQPASKPLARSLASFWLSQLLSFSASSLCLSRSPSGPLSLLLLKPRVAVDVFDLGSRLSVQISPIPLSHRSVALAISCPGLLCYFASSSPAPPPPTSLDPACPFLRLTTTSFCSFFPFILLLLHLSLRFGRTHSQGVSSRDRSRQQPAGHRLDHIGPFCEIDRGVWTIATTRFSDLASISPARLKHRNPRLAGSVTRQASFERISLRPVAFSSSFDNRGSKTSCRLAPHFASHRIAPLRTAPHSIASHRSTVMTMSEKSNFLSPSMSPSSSSSGGNPPPPYGFHHLPHSPTGSRTPSRPGSPPHGGSVPSPGGVPGTFVLNLGKFGGFYIIRIPPTVQKVLGILLRKWKTLIFVALFGTLAAFGLFGAMSTEWREMTYYRVDPYPLVPAAHKSGSGGSSSPFHPPASRPNTPPKFGACLGPKGVPVPRAPAELYDTPDTHPIPLVGSYEAAGMDFGKCMTYRSRYKMYSDEALNITYRKDISELESYFAKAEDYDDDPDNVKPVKSKLKSSLQANSTNSTSSSTAKGDAPSTPEKIDPLYGPRKPDNINDDEWEGQLRDRLWRANVLSEELGPSSYPDWRALMDNCYQKRLHDRGMAGGVDRFDPHNLPTTEEPHTSGSRPRVFTTPETKRTAVVMRSYEGYAWREDDILNLRALISELSLNNPNTPYDVRILVEVKSAHLAVFTSEWDRLNVLRSSVPREFWGLVELWTEGEMCALYPGLPGKFLNKMFAQTSYRSCLMALQKFYLDHQEYDFIYNWEMDVRYIGNYLDFFEGIEEYSRNEALHSGMDKYDTWLVRNVTVSEENWRDNTSMTVGRGQEADLITLGPIFDPRGSGWYWEYDVQNYPPGQSTDRRASIGTNMRMSRALLEAMNVVNAEAKKSLHCEAWPTTLVLHSQLPMSHDHSFYPEAGFTHNLPLPFKGVFVPHPVYFRHVWEPEVLHTRINRPDFYKKINEKVMRDSSFYYDGKHSREVYVGWKEKENVCRAPMLLHPIKRIN